MKYLQRQPVAGDVVQSRVSGRCYYVNRITVTGLLRVTDVDSGRDDLFLPGQTIVLSARDAQPYQAQFDSRQYEESLRAEADLRGIHRDELVDDDA